MPGRSVLAGKLTIGDMAEVHALRLTHDSKQPTSSVAPGGSAAAWFDSGSRVWRMARPRRKARRASMQACRGSRAGARTQWPSPGVFRFGKAGGSRLKQPTLPMCQKNRTFWCVTLSGQDMQASDMDCGTRRRRGFPLRRQAGAATAAPAARARGTGVLTGGGGGGGGWYWDLRAIVAATVTAAVYL